ncbi:MAG: hypothetical protein AWU57_1437, partial [Marinobacter sp. T13-3]
NPASLRSDGWQPCSGPGGRLHVEWVATFSGLRSYCHLRSYKIRKRDLTTRSFRVRLQEFFRVLKGDSLIARTLEFRRITFEVLKDALINVYYAAHGAVPIWLQETEWNEIAAEELDLASLDEVTLLYWGGWRTQSRKGREIFLEFHELYHSHGREFTVQHYTRWLKFNSKQSAPNTRIINRFARFLNANAEKWPTSTFDDPIKITKCFKDFLKDNFLTAHQENRNLTAEIKAWNRFISNIDEVFFQSGTWPEPFGEGIPKLSLREVAGAQTRVSRNDSGVEVHDKLITEVPLQFTDDQAIELIFSQIRKDLDLIEAWATAQAWSLRKRQLKRKQLAKQGSPFAPNFMNPSKARELKYIPDDALPDLCARFEHHGYLIHKPDQSLDVLYCCLQRQPLAYQFGLPTVDSLFPFMCLLVLKYPKITHSFLQDLELYDKNNQLSGFVKTDSGYQLTGYKDRRKKHHAEQKILLSARSAVLVHQVIQITQPLRDYLRKNGDNNWRKLFLTCGKSFGYPKAGHMTYWSGNVLSSKFSELEDQFGKFTNLKGERLKKFLCRVTLGSIRASKAVQIYLDTKSVQQMAEALGHLKYNPKLLSHYLPDSILAFFQTRWIRIFQKAFICEAMKDSPYLLKATEFQSMEELHEFLKNHAIKEIPEHLSDPLIDRHSLAIESNDQVVISIDKGILTALLSLDRAVETAKKKENLSGLAIYWSTISKLIEKEIIKNNDHLLRQHLVAAKENIDPKKMEELIYDTAK